MTRLTAAFFLGTSLALSAPAMAFDISAMTDDEKAAFGEAVRDYLMENPQVLIESINVLENRQAQDAAQTDLQLVEANSDALFDDGHSWVGGNPDGDLTMVEFIDYRCGVCRQFNAEVHDAVEEDGNIRLILKEFPILGEESVLSSRFAISVHQIAGDEAYKKAHDALMALRAPATDESLRGIAEEIGVDADAIMAHMDTEAVNTVLQKNHELGQTMAIQGTPTFVIGDQMLRGVPRAGVAQTIAQIRESM
ncbi:DsbA family protein [Paracoccus sp. NBH48]|uniref:DsbA family protein n=1 Tax=Paracoccus sp. NBH48 TaxID=2596918 RepID=UPI001890B9E9|nr:DsbA family protein [Paracoccus sp. NBH48]MBF5078109.1 DsbA family protein [Paracoccus sp. NBH48]